MSNDNQGRGARTTSGNAPAGSAIAIVVTLVAVLLGFFILRRINDHGTTSTTKPTTADSTLNSGGSSTSAAATTTTGLVFTGTKVQVANASNSTGVAKSLTLDLAAKGFDTATATNATLSPKLAVSKVLYNSADANALPVANSVATVLGGIAVEATTAAPPVTGAKWAAGSGVIVLLGNDLAGKKLSEITPAAGGSSATSSSLATAAT